MQILLGFDSSNYCHDGSAGNDGSLLMSYSGHTSIESLNIYLHEVEKDRIFANQGMYVVGDLLGTFAGITGNAGN